MANTGKESVCRNPRVVDGRVVCEDDVIVEEDKQPAKKEVKEKCEFLYDSTNKQKLQVCTKNGKPNSAKLMTGEFSKEDE